MSNLIPPLLSDSPPPIVGPLDEDDDDEFGDFRAAATATDSYDCDDFSLPPSPQKSPEKLMIENEKKPTVLDINSNNNNNNEKLISNQTTDVNDDIVICDSNQKDFQDKRKTDDENDVKSDDNQVNSSNSLTNDDSSTFNEDIEENGPNNDDDDDHDDLNIENCDNSNNKLESLDSDGIGDDIIEHNDDDDDDDGDDFGGFETHFHKNDIENDASQSDNVNNSQIVQSKINNDDDGLDDDDFTDFHTVEPKIEDIKNDEKTIDCDIKKSKSDDDDDDDDDFADFHANPFEIKSNLEDNDDFGDFEAPPPIQQISNLSETINKNDDDDDDDFTEFTSNQPVLLLDSNDVFNKCETIVKEIFPKIVDDIDDFDYVDNTENDTLFNSLKDITETYAINYQWSKSNSQKVLLKSLNIDMRNILYGPGWSSSMPKFAANLGVTPLEPIKTTEIRTPIPVQQNQSSPSSSVDSSQKDSINNVDIPNVQFDWNDSGLINPLDSTSSKKEETTGNIEDISQDQEKSDLFLTNITEKIKNLTTTPSTIEDNDNKIRVLESPKMIPLRETHISNDNISLEKPDWFQSTIQTPELPRKIDFLNDNNDDDNNNNNNGDEDDFDDFQMVLPETKTTTTIIENVNLHIINNSKDQPVEEAIKSEHNNNSNDDDDDEFTDFHSTLPTVLQPVPLEPLKPSIINPISSTPAQINWPEPGVSDDEIRNIEVSYSRNTIDDNKSNDLFKPILQEQQQQVKNSGVSSVDDDEWSDFVSVVPTLKSSTTTIERTATPDLPLSVLNLNYIQPAKPPIPVVTPNGLVQTKLSINLDNAPKSTNIVQTKISTNYQQPTLITNQFNNLQSANFDLLTPIKPTHIQTNFNQPTTQFDKNNKNNDSCDGGGDDEDEDWSDFVSSQPTVNGYQMKMNQNKTNITTNPNFDTFQNYTNPIRKNSFINNNGQQWNNNNGLSNIATIPDLDFIAPKSRTNKK